MNSKIYIQKKLIEIHSIIRNISIRYEYDLYSNMHVVEILPLNMYSENRDYIEREIELTKEFNEQFPDEDILFISQKSLTKISNPEFSLLPLLKIASKIEDSKFLLSENEDFFVWNSEKVNIVIEEYGNVYSTSNNPYTPAA